MTPTALRLTEVVKTGQQARRERDALIRQRRAEGASFRAIAVEADVSPREVQRIVRR